MGASKHNPRAIAKRRHEEAMAGLRGELRKIQGMRNITPFQHHDAGTPAIDQAMRLLQDRMDAVARFSPSVPFEARPEARVRMKRGMRR
jgi:hypothetical protein